MKFRRRVVPKNIQLGGLLTIFTIIWLVLLCSYTNVKVILKGNVYVKTPVNKPYIDQGFLVYDMDRLVDSKNIKYHNNNNVNSTIIGRYKYAYEVYYGHKEYYLERIVEVVDEEPPLIEVKQSSVRKDYCTNKIKENLEYKAVDNYDGDITDSVVVLEKEDKYILSSTDSSGNSVISEISIIYDNKPKDSLSLNGSKTTYIKLNDSYNELGANYNNGCKIIKNASIKIEGNVDTSKVGTYSIKYSYNKLSVTRKVVVYDASSTDNNKKIIYLTFDDGPSKYTSKLLDVLDKYNVKATFFVVGNYTSLIKEEYNRGHAIGVHTLTHNWSIYKSLETYLDDFNKMNDIIEQQTGSRSMIFRFPGGSSNAVSKKYAKGIVTEIANYMTDAGYVYYDWNVSAADASNNTGEDVYKNVVNGVKNCSRCVILMHDSKQKTVNQVENIIKTFIERGYTFATLDTNGPVVHHNIKN